MTDSSPPSHPAARLRLAHHRPRPGVAVLRPAGEMDALGAPAVAARIAALASTDACVVLDMRLVTFVDARGIHALLAGDRAARRSGARLIVVGVDHTTWRVLRICGVERELTLMDVADGERAGGVALTLDGADGVADPDLGRPAAGT